MNYLVHLYLSDPDPEVRLGNLLGDWVKGRLDETAWPEGVLRGLRQHRSLDRHSVTSPAVRRSKARIDERFGLLKPVLVDIFYDHLLAAHWGDYHDQSLESFSREIYRLFSTYDHLLPTAFRPVARRMKRYNWLISYREPATISMVLQRISDRLRRPNPLGEGVEELDRQYDGFREDFDRFLTEFN